MATLPLLNSTAPAPRPGNMTIAPQELPRMPDGSAVGAAMGSFGASAFSLGDAMEKAASATREATATTNYLTRLDELETKYANDPDWQNAPTKFKEDLRQLHQDTREQAALNPKDDATLGLKLTKLGITSDGTVSKAANKRMIDENVASLDASETSLLGRATRAQSPAEREAATSDYYQLVEKQAQLGIIDQRTAVARQKAFTSKLETSDIVIGIRSNPGATLAALRNPENYQTMDPLQRLTLERHAEAAAAQATTDRITARAQWDLPAAVMDLGGRVSSPHEADQIFVRGIMPTENGPKDPNAVSEKGAIGLSQILPGTARDMAKKLGIADVAAMDDATITERLKKDSALNQQLGLTYWRELVGRYQGNTALAAAAYNGGMKNADRWRDAAVEKFGEQFTPAQLASVVDFKETREYIGKVWAQFGSDPNGPQLPPHDFYRAANSLSQEYTRQQTQTKQWLSDLASTQRSNDDIVEIYKAGFSVDPVREQSQVRTQQQAAAAGDKGAQEWLRKYDDVKANAPLIREAYGMPPAMLETATGLLEAKLGASPDVSSEDYRRLQAFKSVRDEITRRQKTDPIALGERAGMLQPVPIDPNAKADDAGFQQALALRGRQADWAQAQYQGDNKPFHPAEASALKERFAAMGEHERFEFISTMARSMSPSSYSAALGQIGGDSITQIAGQIALTRPDLARDVLHGAALLSDPGVKPKTDAVRGALQAKLPPDLYPDPRMQKDVIDAALAKYAADRGKIGALYDAADAGAIEKAIEAVTGPIVRRNGVKVAAPANMNAGQFSSAFDRLDNAGLAQFGGAYDRNGRELDAATVRDYGVLKQVAPGSSQYFVGMRDANARDGFAPFLTAPNETNRGLPLVVDARQLFAAAAAKERIALTPRQKGVSGEQIVRQQARADSLNFDDFASRKNQ